MADRVSITAADGHVLEAWCGTPDGPPTGGIVFLQAIYGLTDHIGAVCDRFAADGFATLAPALYDRTERGRTFPYDADGVAAGRAFRDNLAEPTVIADVAACVATLHETTPKVAISGFCTGGSWAWICAGAMAFDAAVIFYGSDLYETRDRRPVCPTLLHYGDSDHVVPVDRVVAIRAANPECKFRIYPGAGHAFFNPDQDHYDAEAAALAHERTVRFLERSFAA